MNENHSPKFAMVQRFYNTWKDGQRLWDKARVANAVVKGWILPSEYMEITGEEYIPEE